MSNQTQTILERAREAFDFNVVKMPLSGPDNMKTPLYGLFRDDNSQLVGDSSVTGRYVPHTTDDVCTIIEATQSVFDDCDAQFHFRDGHYVNLAPSDDNRRLIYDNGKQQDNIFPRLTIRAGYDGKSFMVWMGYFRDLCKNLSMMESVKTTYVKIRHTRGLRDKMTELIDQFSGLREGWDDLGDLIDGMNETPVQLATFLENVYGKPPEKEGRGATIHANRTEKIFRRVLDERRRSGRPELDDLFTVSSWEAYNAVQGYVQHDASRRNDATGFDRIILASRDASVKKAEHLAYAAVSA